MNNSEIPASIQWVDDLKDHIEGLEADALGCGIGDVLERRVVSEEENQVCEWRLMVSGSERVFEWVPTVVDKRNGSERYPQWMMLPGSQQVFLSCPIFEALYEGTRGPGKTLTLLMDFAKDVGKGYGDAWRGILFRRQFGDLDDVVRKIEEWFPKIFPGFRFLKSKSEYMGVWPDGEALLLRHMNGPEDYNEYHGHEYPWIGWEELTQWESPEAFDLMMSCCRPPRPGVPRRIRATTNPYGVGHVWVKKRYRLPEKRNQVIRNPGEMPRVAIHGGLKENFLLTYAEPDYPVTIRQAARNPAQAEAWLNADWNVTSGGMIDDLWNSKTHTVPPIPAEKIPSSWKITRAYDHGQSHPFAVGWFLESSGEPIIIDGKRIGSVRGDRIMWQEWYGTTGQPNEGVRMPASRIGAGIRDREEDFGVRVPQGRSRVVPGPADTEIFNKAADRDGRCPADDMEDEGVDWERADKTPHSRRRGWEMMRSYLQNAFPERDGTRDKPGFFICSNCEYALDLVPPMPRASDDPDDVPKSYEDHICDMIRYFLNWEIPGMWRRGF